MANSLFVGKVVYIDRSEQFVLLREMRSVEYFILALIYANIINIVYDLTKNRGGRKRNVINERDSNFVDSTGNSLRVLLH